MAIVTGGIWFPVVILIGIPAAIRDAEHLALCWRFGFVWQLASWKLTLFGIYFSSIHTMTFPEDCYHYRTPGLVNWGASENWWSSCSYRKSSKGSITFARPHLGPGATRIVGFHGSEIELTLPGQTWKGLSFSTFCPCGITQTHPLSRLIPSRSAAPSASKAALSGKRLLLLTSAPGEVEANWIMTSDASGLWCHGGLWSQPESSRL